MKKKPDAAKSRRSSAKPSSPKSAPKRRGVVRNKPPEESLSSQIALLLGDAFWLMSLLLVVYVAACLVSYSTADPAWSRSYAHRNLPVRNVGGLFGAYVSDIAYYLAGISVFWLLFGAALGLVKSFRPLFKRRTAAPYHPGWGVAGMILLLLFSSVVEHLFFNNTLLQHLPLGSGGLIGTALSAWLTPFVGLSGCLMLSLAAMLIGLSLLVQLSWVVLIEKIGTRLEWLWLTLIRKPHRFVTTLPRDRTTRRMVKTVQELTEAPLEAVEGAKSNRKPLTPATPEFKIQTSLFEEESTATPVSNKKSKPASPPSRLLPLPELLRSPQAEPEAVDPLQLQATAERIEAKLGEFHIGAHVLGATSGPVITRFEIEPAQGVKGSQIVNLGRDLARALSVQSVRVIETIAGKSSMGLELPNLHRREVVLSEIIRANAFQGASSKLTLALGVDIAGTPMAADLAKMPHLLVAGTTGSGKSVAINSMILSLLFKATPEEVRLIMVDPKMLELSVYQDIPHLLAPVVTDMKEAANALNWCVAEMEKRYRLLAHAGVRKLEDFNTKVREQADTELPLLNPFSPNPDEPEPLQPLPYIVVVIDELADLMMVEGKKVEQQIARLAQKARAAGIHLILATQRPSVDVITGLIKANIPTRMSFQVSSRIDSRTILDQIGAENLLGKGDMLFLPPGTAEPVRLHGAFVSDEEVHQIVAFLKRHSSPQYVEGILAADSTAEPSRSGSPAADDELFDQAVAFVVETRKTSISSLQRHLRIGYNRAANLMESLEQAQVVSAPDVGGSRRILAPRHDE